MKAFKIRRLHDKTLFLSSISNIDTFFDEIMSGQPGNEWRIKVIDISEDDFFEATA